MKPGGLPTVFFILGMSLFSLAAVTKKQDPILETQTDPVSYREEQKEEREGRKGPASPTLDFFPKQGFAEITPSQKTAEGHYRFSLNQPIQKTPVYFKRIDAPSYESVGTAKEK